MKLLLILPFLICSLFASAQNWAPDSAVWHYDFALFAERGYVKITVDGDSVINGQTVRVLRKNRYSVNMLTGDLASSFIGTEYTYEDSNKVYYFRQGKFYTLYDFNAEAGDSWIVAGNEAAAGGCDSMATVVVDSVSYVVVHNDTLKVLFMEFDLLKPLQFVGAIYERIGGIGYMFPEPNCITDSHEGGPLRCYRDPQIGLFQKDLSNACDFLPTGLNDPVNTSINIYPIPAMEVLYIQIPENEFTGLTFFDMAGRLIYDTAIQPSQTFITLSVSTMPAGIYHLILINNKVEKSISKKVVVE